jgi:hypothetical protein
MIVVNKYLVPNGYAAITLYPFIILKDKKYRSNETLINHERIHIAQQKELLVVGFYILYVLNWLVNLVIEPDEAYRSIVFEQEAKEYESYLIYLQERPNFNWIDYV